MTLTGPALPEQGFEQSDHGRLRQAGFREPAGQRSMPGEVGRLGGGHHLV